MARALLVGCGCRGRALGRELLESGWAVRGTSRRQEGVAEISAAGIEGVVADPDRVGSVLDHVGDVTVLAWLMGSAEGTRQELVALEEERLGSLLEKLVDTPVRGFVLEGAGSVPDEIRAAAAGLVEDAARRWSIRTRIVDADPADYEAWLGAMAEAVPGVLAAWAGSVGSRRLVLDPGSGVEAAEQLLKDPGRRAPDEAVREVEGR